MKPVTECQAVLEAFHTNAPIDTVTVHNPMPHNTVFSINNGAYFILQDDSAMDDVRFVVDQLKEVETSLRGQIIPNPIPQPDGALFACGVQGKEYYLWRSL